MAYCENSFVSNRATLRKRLARAFESPFDRRYRQRAREIEALRKLSERDLVARHCP